tara:strand:- start:989 stop:1108 length:120 start_codon:yes stop_codon:yes gene_type:complete
MYSSSSFSSKDMDKGNKVEKRRRGREEESREGEKKEVEE